MSGLSAMQQNDRFLDNLVSKPEATGSVQPGEGYTLDNLTYECHTAVALATTFGQTVTSSLSCHWTMIGPDNVFRPV